MKAVAVILFAALGLAIAGQNSAFDAYLSKYNKAYTGAEYNTRLQIWNQAVQDVAAHRTNMIAQGEQPWKGINEFSDMTREEFLNSGRVMKTKLQAKDAVSCLAKGVTVDESALSYDIPTEFNWVTKNVVSPIQNQAQCGSCWAFSTVSAIESATAIKTGNLTKLSEQEIVDCSHGCIKEDGQQVCNQGCDGGWPWSAMTDIVGWGGLDTEKNYPYKGTTDACKKKGAAADPIKNYTCLSGPNYANETTMAAFLVANGPLSIAMDAGLLQTYTSGIIKPTAGECSTTQLDHAINIVGYGTEGSTDFWIIRNSWADSWGEKGYFRIIRGKGACGLNAGVVFPIV